MIKLFIISDDLTGALDTGVQFSKKGIPIVVSTSTNYDLLDLNEKYNILIINIESRHISMEDAKNRVITNIQKAKEIGIQFFYKKIDSTFRGNIGSELTSFLRTIENRILILVPAYPKTGRTTENGHQFINKIPINETSFAKDPLNPIKESYIPKIIKSQSEINTIVIKQNRYDIDFSKINQETIYIFDLKNDADFEKITNILKKYEINAFAGCAGFAEYLPNIIDFQKEELIFEKPAKPYIVINGSVNKQSINQINHFKRKGIEIFKFGHEEIYNENFFDTEEGKKSLSQIQEILKNKGEIILRTITHKDDLKVYLNYGLEKGLKKEKIHQIIAKNMAIFIKAILETQDINTLVIIGGDTLSAIIEALGCNYIIPKIEIFPGIIISEIVSNNYNLKIITKAGGFGSKDVLQKIKKYIEK